MTQLISGYSIRRTLLLLSIATFCSVLSLQKTALANNLPADFEQMEIEAKWDTDETTFNNIVAAFIDGTTKYNHVLDVRWSARPRRYVDVYYDDSASTLDADLHVLRHRQRAQTNSAIAISNTFSMLGSVAWNPPDWEKVQYKSTPTRLAAVWFREEKGDADLNSLQVESTLNGVAASIYLPDDNPVAKLLEDHTGFDFSTLEEKLTVTQYRYRVQLDDPSTGQPIYELSMDKVITQLANQPTGLETFAVEMELLADAGITASRVDFLFEIMQMMENEFTLTRSTTSKGGNVVDDSAVPELRVDTPIIGYGNVQTGLSFSKPVEIYNDGLADLEVDLIYPTQSDSANWPALSGTQSYTLGIGDEPLLVSHVYTPQDVNDHSIQVTLSSNDLGAGDQLLTLQGRGIPPTPIDSVLVLDRSGSMDDLAGERRKIEVMRAAADLYVHLLRDAIPGSTETDEVGMVKYNNVSSVYLPLEAVDDPSNPNSHISMAENLLDDSALMDSSLLLPDDATGIGGAMETAANMFVTSAGQRKHVMILLTDGIENRSPFIDDVRDPILAANAALDIYSIGVGDNYEPAKLQSITNVTGGYHQVSDELTGVSLFDLENFYFKIFAHVNGMDFIVDPTFLVPINSVNATIVDTATVTSSDRSIVFLLLENPVLRQFYDLELIAPTGEVVNNTSVIGGEKVKFVQRHTYTTIKLTLPSIEKTKDYIGKWHLRLTPNKTWDPEIIKKLADSETTFITSLRSQAIKGIAPVGFSAAVASDYTMRINAFAKEYKPGELIGVTVQLRDKGVPVTNAKVNMRITSTADSGASRLNLYDNGKNGDAAAGDGRYTAYFKSNELSTTYRFLVRSQGRNANGENVSRESDIYVSLIDKSRDK